MKKSSLMALMAVIFCAPESMQAIKQVKVVKSKASPVPIIEPAYFQPALTHRLLGVGSDREGMSVRVLELRTERLIQSQTFSIMRDPKAVSGAAAITSPALQVIFTRAAEASGFPKETLEAIAFDESWGDPNAISPQGAKGIMQITGDTAKLMGLKKHKETRYKMVPQRKLIKKAHKGQPAIYQDLPDKREKFQVEIDERMDPEKAIPAAAQFLSYLQKRYARLDFAVWAYHSGEGFPNKALALARKYGIEDPSVAKIFFGNNPVWRKDLYVLIKKDMEKDLGSTYFFTITKAEQLLALYRDDPQGYKKLAREYVNPINSEERSPNRLYKWLSPKAMYPNNAALEAATGKQLVEAPACPPFFSYSLRTSGAEAIGEKDPANRKLFMQDPPEVIGGLLYISFETRRLYEKSNPKKEFVPIDVTSLIRNLVYQKLLQGNPNAHTDFPTHTIGAVDMSYLHLPALEAECLKFVIQDMGFDEYISYYLESKARLTMHVGTAPAHRDFFTTIYHEATEKYISQNKGACVRAAI